MGFWSWPSSKCVKTWLNCFTTSVNSIFRVAIFMLELIGTLDVKWYSTVSSRNHFQIWIGSKSPNIVPESVTCFTTWTMLFCSSPSLGDDVLLQVFLPGRYVSHEYEQLFSAGNYKRWIYNSYLFIPYIGYIVTVS